jgi:hypothetical protein
MLGRFYWCCRKKVYAYLSESALYFFSCYKAFLLSVANQMLNICLFVTCQLYIN